MFIGPGILAVLIPLYALSHLTITAVLTASDYNYLILHTRTLKHREAEKLVQVPSARMCQSQNSKPGSWVSETMLNIFLFPK